MLANNVTATFSEQVDPMTISNTTFQLACPGNAPVSGTVTFSGQTATFDPSASLANNTVYIATITTGVKDTAGNPMANNYVWSFTTTP